MTLRVVQNIVCNVPSKNGAKNSSVLIKFISIYKQSNEIHNVVALI